MKQGDIEKLIAERRKEVARHDTLYHKNARPEITDYEYDRLKNELSELEKQHPEFSDEGSPIHQVGDDRHEGFDSYRHLQPMMSLDNTYNEEELSGFDKRLQKLLGVDELIYLIEPKIDGVAVSLTYEKRNLVRAVTRGNGIEGDVITKNLEGIDYLPTRIKDKSCPEVIEIRGEIYMTHPEFERINKEREEAALDLYANPRNLAAGTIKQIDPKIAKRRKLDIVLYGLGYCSPLSFSRQREFQELLKSWNMPTVEKYWMANGIAEAWKIIEELENLRETFAYSTDGAVIKLDALDQQRVSGSTSKSPRWAIAYKFAAEQAETKILKINIQIGRTGTLTPVAELKPVFLDGSTVSHATLHNEDEIKRKDIREGDSVIIEKAGDIIPAIVRVLTDSRKSGISSYVFPQVCPACGTETIRLPGEAARRCPNLSCPPQVRGRIEHFTSRQCMDIEGLGEAVVDQLVSKNLINNIADLYKLIVNDLLPLEKFAQKSSENLIQAIESSKKCELWRLIHGLGIQHIGATASKDLARSLHSLQALIDANEDDLMTLDGIGEIMAKSVNHFFSQESNKEIILRLIGYGLNVEEVTPTESETHDFSGKSFVLTGTLASLTREAATQLIENVGGHVTSSVSKNTDFILAGESAGSKLAQAQKLGTKIIDEKEFQKLLKR